VIQAATQSRAQFAAEIGCRPAGQPASARIPGVPTSTSRINPTGIVPKGPELDLTKPHDRG